MMDWLNLTYAGLPQQERLIVERHRLLMWVIGVAVFVVAELVDEFAFRQPDRWISRYAPRAITFALGLIVISLTSRYTAAQWVKRSREREAVRRLKERAARLEGALLAARTMEHRLNNQLALTAGYSEILASSPVPTPALGRAAEAARRGVHEASATLEQFASITQLETDDSLGVTIVDIERSLNGTPEMSRDLAR